MRKTLLLLAVFLVAALVPFAFAQAEGRSAVLRLSVNLPQPNGVASPVPLEVLEGESPYAAALRFGQQHGLNQDGIAHVAKYIVDRAGDLVKRVLFNTTVAIKREDGTEEHITVEVFEGATADRVAQEVAVQKNLDDKSTAALTRHIARLIEEKTLVRVKVNLGSDAQGRPRVGEIVVQEGADWKRAVNEFAQKHSLTEAATQQVLSHVQTQVQQAILKRQEAKAQQDLEQQQAKLRQQQQQQELLRQQQQQQQQQAAAAQQKAQAAAAAAQQQQQKPSIFPFTMKLDLGNGRSDTITVNANDNVDALARAFAARNQLGEGNVEVIKKYIVEQAQAKHRALQQQQQQ